MNHTKYLALLAGCSFVAACENPVDGDLNVDNPDAYTLVYTVNAVENDSKSTLTFPLERDTVFSVYANLAASATREATSRSNSARPPSWSMPTTRRSRPPMRPCPKPVTRSTTPGR